jgi:hypothetical protein
MEQGGDDRHPRAGREWLVQADHVASRDFDKALMTLSAGALALSLAFIRDIAPSPTNTAWLGAAWIGFAASLLSILVSFLASQAALRREIENIDGTRTDNRPGGAWSIVTRVCNWLSALLLVGGAAALIVFALYNIDGGQDGERQGPNPEANPTAATEA